MHHLPVEYLKHILDECIYLLQEYETNSFEQLKQNRRLAYAVCRSLEIIGEATKKLSYHFREKYPEVEWKKMAGIRDVIIHDYLNVDLEVVWEVVSLKIPILKQQIETIIKQESAIDKHL